MKPSQFRMAALGCAIASFALAASVVFGAQGHSSSSKETKQQILSKMHDVNQMEIQMAQMAAQKGQSQAIKDFGKRLERDHTANDKQVTSVAEKEGIDLVTPEPKTAKERQQMAHHDQVHQELDSAQGRDFDRKFAKAMAEGHAEAVTMLTQARAKVRSGRVHSLVVSTIPTVQRHERLARNLESKI